LRVLEGRTDTGSQSPLPGRSDKSRNRHRRRERRRGLLILVAVFVVLFVAAGAARAYYQWSTGASGPRTPVTIQIPQGATGSEVADLLKKQGVIRSTLAFRLAVRFRHVSTASFEAGEYHLTTNMTIDDVLALLGKGAVAQPVTRLTIPEGLTVAKTAARVHQVLKRVSPRAFVKAATSGTFSLPPYLPQSAHTVEGFLSPDTYDFLKTATAHDVITRLLDQFKTAIANLPWSNAKKLGVTPYQVVIIASIIEREARFQDDRVRVARVSYNRLAQGMRLQSDATVEYALGKAKPALTLDDLKVQSPYNTYLHAGLPPAPIASPGVASLRAALEPANGSWLYFLAYDRAGHAAFASTYQEFLSLRAKYGI
jgi:UPF0755 protein